MELETAFIINYFDMTKNLWECNLALK